MLVALSDIEEEVIDYQLEHRYSNNVSLGVWRET